ncbi:Ctr copper transporter family-domain-containing protein [Suillus paluster]|uniref:Ctr copper transporter family-domain-containing protein n=1 Tax=Suillus paluster TaxID=48578 RepID=UPI001B87605D|nr:Ctr copper transporter family-domain-containing protein [Suillus paluster]KAG1729972.1 Ctr copper transporter family-domain-containing protein [Suillus paluster]
MNWQYLVFCLLCLSQVGLADNGMDMSTDGPMDLAVGNMLPYLHFTPGDNLWFLGWVPKSSGAMIGTCIALFMLALIERWIAACRGVMEYHWRQQATIIASDELNTLPTKSSSVGFIKRFTPPFIPAHDIVRGVMFAAQALLSYLFMLTVMTYQLSFIFSLVVGLGVGETLFGRFSSIGLTH